MWFRNSTVLVLLASAAIACKGGGVGNGTGNGAGTGTRSTSGAREHTTATGNHSMNHEVLQVAAAADLRLAMPDLLAEYTQRSGHEVNVTYGSTGLLAKQIKEGAPFEVFAAADRTAAEGVIASGACEASSLVPYALGQLVLWQPAGVAAMPLSARTASATTAAGSPSSATLPLATRADFDELLGKRIAIANPDHAPYGRAAREAMQTNKVWDAMQAKLVFAENAQQTLQFAQTGNVDAAVIPLSLLPPSGTGRLIEQTAHKPVEQTRVVCRGRRAQARPEAHAFADFLTSKFGLMVLKKYGFLPPATQER
jgi:molybdate transport system substrate-binding protein